MNSRQQGGRSRFGSPLCPLGAAAEGLSGLHGDSSGERVGPYEVALRTERSEQPCARLRCCLSPVRRSLEPQEEHWPKRLLRSSRTSTSSSYQTARSCQSALTSVRMLRLPRASTASTRTSTPELRTCPPSRSR